MTMPLEGIKVLDLSRFGPGLFTTMMLADMGAEVLRIQEVGLPTPGGRGAVEARVADSAFADREAERSSPYYALNRNKKSLCLNLKAPEGCEIFYQLAQNADVIMEAYRPGVVKRLGVDYETIREINPRIVYCSLTGYGQDGPYKNIVGHDANYISIAGALGITGLRNGPPVLPGFQLADFAAGSMHCALGIVLALMARERTGRGQYVDISMTDGVVSLLANQLSTCFRTGVVPRPGEMPTNGGIPGYNVYESQDGEYFSLGNLEPWFWENLCRALGREDFIAHQDTPGEKREEIFAAFRAIFRTKTRDEWFEYLKDKDICVGKVYTLDELESDAQLRHRQMVVEVEAPGGEKIKQVGIPIKLSETPGAIRSLAPSPGQHTAEVLAQLGYSQARIAALRQAGVIK